MPNDSKALALVTAKSAHVHFSPAKPALLLKKLEAIAQLETDAALMALQVGALLWQTKATLKHGEFKPWIEENIKGRGYRSCAYYMKLTLAMAEKSRLDAATFAALPGVDLRAKKWNSAERDALEAMRKFCGELSLSELLIKHGIKGVGMKAELTEGGEAPAELTAGQQLELVWGQTYEPAKSLADLLEEKAATLKPDQREALEAELKRALQALRRA